MCTTRKNKDAIALLPYLTGKILVFTEFFSKDKFTLLRYQTFMRACTISNTKFDSKYANAPTVLPQYLQTLPMRFIATKRQKMTTKSPHFSTQKAPMKFIGSEKNIILRSKFPAVWSQKTTPRFPRYGLPYLPTPRFG